MTRAPDFRHPPPEVRRCPWSIHWGIGAESFTRCARERHGDDDAHSGTDATGATVIEWQAGDRREYVGDYPGPCERRGPCSLPLGHPGKCAP